MTARPVVVHKTHFKAQQFDLVHYISFCFCIRAFSDKIIVQNIIMTRRGDSLKHHNK